MRAFAWLTFVTGLVLSGTAAYFSVFGLALIYAGAFWPVVMLASVMECAKLVGVSWLFRYRHLASWPVRVYFFAATLLLASITSMGIFGYLTRAHVETEGDALVAQLTLQETAAKEASLIDQRTQITTELSSLSQQTTQLMSQLGTAGRLAGSSGAVRVQRENAARRQALLAQSKTLTDELAVVRRTRAEAEAQSARATADIGPLKYVAKAVYGKDDLETVRVAVVWLTVALMLVFDPMAIMLLVAANILFVQSQLPPAPVVVTPPTPAPTETTTTVATVAAPRLVIKNPRVSVSSSRSANADIPVVPLVPNNRIDDIPESLDSKNVMPFVLPTVPFDMLE